MRQKQIFTIIGVFVFVIAVMAGWRSYELYQIKNKSDTDVTPIITEEKTQEETQDKQYKQEGNIEAGIVKEIFKKRSGNGYDLNCIVLEGCPIIFKTPGPITVKEGYTATIKYNAPNADGYALIEEIL